MRNYLLIFVFFMIASVINFGCAERDMHESPDKTPGGQAVIDNEVEPSDRGKEAIQLTSEILFPGSEPYEDAKYEYLAQETPAKVAHWFEINLEDCRVEKISGDSLGEDSWIVTKNDLIIEVHKGPDEENTLIRYKKDINYKNSP